MRLYKDFRQLTISMPGRPDVLRVVDMTNCVVYTNDSAEPGANVIVLLPERWE